MRRFPTRILGLTEDGVLIGRWLKPTIVGNAKAAIAPWEDARSLPTIEAQRELIARKLADHGTDF